IFDKSERPLLNALFTLAGVIYAVLPFALLHELVASSDADGFVFHPFVLFGIILLIWSNDTFAYLGGSIFGKNKMIERVSPGKTWEGTLIGVLLSFGSSFIIKSFFPESQNNFWLLAGIMVPVF